MRLSIHTLDLCIIYCSLSGMVVTLPQWMDQANFKAVKTKSVLESVSVA